MSIDIGIIGLARSGKTTLFHALTGGAADPRGSRDGLAAHVGVARVPEPRLAVLEEMLHPRKVVPAEARYIDVGASVKSLAHDKGLGGELLNQLSAVDTLICVVRAFADDSVPHPDGGLDIDRDIKSLDMELVFSDLAIIERRLEKLEISLKGAAAPERQAVIHEKDILLRLKESLENDRPLRELELDAASAKMLSGFQFLTAKPQLIVVNIGEEQIPAIPVLEKEMNGRYDAPGRRVIALCAGLEMELGQLDESAAADFRAVYSLEESGPERVVKASYELSDLVTFFTIASGEVRAWSTKKGTTAVQAAGKIHTDMEKGFIRAEGIALEDLVKCGGIAEARRSGLLRLEGKDYIVQDGDVITFLFNV